MAAWDQDTVNNAFCDLLDLLASDDEERSATVDLFDELGHQIAEGAPFPQVRDKIAGRRTPEGWKAVWVKK